MVDFVSGAFGKEAGKMLCHAGHFKKSMVLPPLLAFLWMFAVWPLTKSIEHFQKASDVLSKSKRFEAVLIHHTTVFSLVSFMVQSSQQKLIHSFNKGGKTCTERH